MLEPNKSHLANKTLAEWLSYLETIHNTEIDMGLERISIVAQRLNIDLSFSTVITVAGTNGKGTTCSFIENALLAENRSVAVYSSPHIEHFNERLRINKSNVDDQPLIEAFQRIEQDRGKISLTYYEFTTLAAFIILMAQQPDIIILEVGLGGRLDATNLISADIAVITTIDLDHQAFLGNTREAIGYEKAGIMREKQHVVVGDVNAPLSVIDYAHKLKVKLQQRNSDFFITETKDENNIEKTDEVNGEDIFGQWSWRNNNSSLSGLNKTYIPQDNVATALSVLTLLNVTLTTKKVNSIIEQTKVAGRTELIKGHCDILLDVGHNPQAARYLAKQVSQMAYQNIYAVVGMLVDKDIVETFKPMLPFIEYWHLGGLSMPRGANANRLAESLVSSTSAFNCFDNITQAFRMASQNANENDLILVFGSFHTVAEVRRLIL
jgi:dihydrofolate synthase/folylpolyglutamate synthase